MAIVRPFKAIRPAAEYAGKVASLPYDVMNRKEAAEMAAGNPYSFLQGGGMGKGTGKSPFLPQY